MNACPTASAMVGNFRPERYTLRSGLRMSGPMAPMRGRSRASFTSAPRVPAETSASGFSRNTNGARDHRIPWFTAALNPRLSGFSTRWTSGWASTARRALPSCDALSTRNTSSEASPADANTDARHRSRCSPAL